MHTHTHDQFRKQSDSIAQKCELIFFSSFFPTVLYQSLRFPTG